MKCDEALPVISAAADGELGNQPDDVLDRLDRHLRDCPDCRRFAESISKVRTQLRFEPVGVVPDVAPEVLTRLRSTMGAEPLHPEPLPPARSGDESRDGSSHQRFAPIGRARGGWRAAAVAAVVGMLLGASIVGIGRDPQSPAAADLPARVVEAQRDIAALDIEFRLTEGGRPDRRDGTRSFDGRLLYETPETLTLDLTEVAATRQATRTADVDGEGDVRLVVSEETWQLDAVRACTPLPDVTRCPAAATTWQRTVSGREPFSQTAPIPLELVSPVDSFTLAGTPAALGDRRIAGHQAVGVRVPASQITAFLAGMSPADDLRAVHPTDQVDVWLDRESLVPLAVEIRAADIPERARWAEARGYRETAGDTVLAYEAVSVEINASVDRIPGGDDAGGDDAESAGFQAGEPSTVPSPDVLPEGFRPHRAGVVTTPGGPTVGVRSWTDGRAWVKVRATAEWTGDRLFGDLGATVRAVDLGAAGEGYVSADGRRIALHTENLDLVIAGSLPEADLVAIAASLGVEGRAIPGHWAEAASATLEQAHEATANLLVAGELDGFASPAVRVDDATVALHYAGPGTRSFVLTQTEASFLAPPSARDTMGVEVRGGSGRYSQEQGVLEWIEGGASYSLSSATLSFTELLAIAEGLEAR